MANPPATLSVQCFDLLSDTLSDPVKRLFASLEQVDPQFGLDWLTNLSRHALNPDEKALLLVATIGDEEGDDEIAALPVKLVGGECHALGNFYTSLYCPAARAEDPMPLFTALLRFIASNLRASSITLAPMAADHPSFGQLQQALGDARWQGVHPYFCFANWIHRERSGRWESYLSSRPSRVRNTLKRRTKKMLGNGAGSVNIVTGGPTLEAAISDYTEIYNSSWKREEPYAQFTPALIRLAAERGWLRLGIALFEEQAIAAQIWLINGDAAFIFKLAYKQDFAHLSPGTVLTAHMLQHAIEQDQVTCIDYLSGDDAYKQDWMSERRERHGLAAYNTGTWRGRAHFIWHSIKQLGRRHR